MIMPLQAGCPTRKTYCKGMSDGNWQDVEYGDKKGKVCLIGFSLNLCAFFRICLWDDTHMTSIKIV